MRQFSLILVLMAIAAFTGDAIAAPISANDQADSMKRNINFRALTVFKDSYLATMNEAGIFDFESEISPGLGRKRPHKSFIAVNFSFKNNPSWTQIRRKRKREKIYMANLFDFSESVCTIFDDTFIGRKMNGINSFFEPPTMSRTDLNNMIFVSKKIS